MQHKSLIVLFISSLLLYSCAKLPTHQLTIEEIRNIQARNNWTMQGKISVISQTQQESGFITWQQQQDRYSILIRSHFNLASAKITGNNKQLQLLTSDGETYTSGNPQQLLTTQLGWEFPLHHLKHWIKGVPNNTLASTKKNNGFSQQGWLVQYTYLVSAGTLIPKSITLHKEQTTIKIIIHNWQWQ